MIWSWPWVKVTWSIALYIMCPMYLQSLKLLSPIVKELSPIVKEMHLQENTLFDHDPKVKGWRSHKMLPSTHDIMWPMHQQRLMLPHPMVKEKMHLQENMLFDLGAKVTQNVAQYPRHHVTYAPAKFDVARRRYTYKKIHYLALTLGSRSHKMLPSALYIIWPTQLQNLKLLHLTV